MKPLKLKQPFSEANFENYKPVKTISMESGVLYCMDVRFYVLKR